MQTPFTVPRQADLSFPVPLRIQVVGHSMDPRATRDVQVASNVDVLVATGDLTGSAVATIRLLRRACPRPLPIVLVLGPKELAGTDRQATLKRARRSAAANGVVLLDDGVAMLNGVRFVGTTFWSDLRLHGPDAVIAALEAAEHCFVSLDIGVGAGRRLDAFRSTGLHWWSRSWLALTLNDAAPTVVVTHHAPTGAGLSSSSVLDPLAATRASRCDDLVRYSQASLWCHGGCEMLDHVIGETRLVSRPRRDGDAPAVVAVTGQKQTRRGLARP